MHNNFKFFIIFFFINLLFIPSSYSNEIFNFDVSEIEVTENGNKIKGLNRGVITTKDGLIIEGNSGELFEPKKEHVFQTFQDHRILMSLAIASLRSTEPLRVVENSSATVSFANFFDLLEESIRRSS